MESKPFSGNGFKSGGFLNLTPRDAYYEAKTGNAFIVNVREESLTGNKRFGAPRIIYLPLSELNQNISLLTTDSPLIIADSTGLSRRKAMEILTSKGFDLIANLADSMIERERDGLLLVINNKKRLVGSCLDQQGQRFNKL